MAIHPHHSARIVPAKAFQEEVGEERANAVARKALAEWARQVGRQMEQHGTGTSVEKMAASFPMLSADDALDAEVLKQTPDVFELNITRCRYAQFYQELGEPELGFLFLCAQDFPIAESLSGDVELVRTQTIMQGASYWTSGRICAESYGLGGDAGKAPSLR